MLWVTTPAFADICFSNDEAADIVVKLEKANICENQVATLEEQIALLEKKVELLERVNQLEKEQLEISKQTIEQMKEISKQKDVACDQKVKDAKPSFWGTVLQNGFFAAIGVVVGVLIM